jgi:hypothetical protein
MDLDVRHLTGFIVIVSGAGVLAMSYVAAFLIGKNAGRKEGNREGDRRDSRPAAREPERLDRIESAVDAIALQVERLGEGQRYLLGTREAAGSLRPERRHTTPV